MFKNKSTILLTLFALCFWLPNIGAQNLQLQADGPGGVVVEDIFTISYTIAAKDIKNFELPAIKDLEVLHGPATSVYNSTRIVNGKASSEHAVTYTYTLVGRKAGTFTIPAASIVANGKKIHSQQLTIEVFPLAKSSKTKKGAPLFITATVNKNKVLEQEPLILTYKIYTKETEELELQSFTFPDFKGFHAEELASEKDTRWKLEMHKGQHYRTTVFRRFLLTPQHAGNLSIDSALFNFLLVRTDKTADFFDAIFNNYAYKAVESKELYTPKQAIQVEALPAQDKPTPFSGVVGEYKMSSSVNHTSQKANEPIQLTITIEGTGNLKLLPNPEIQLPANLEIYDPKVEYADEVLTSQGWQGKKVFEYPIIPRQQGRYTIPSISYNVFNLKSRTYQTLHTEAYTLDVQPGDKTNSGSVSNFTTNDPNSLVGKDIRDIEEGDVKLNSKGYTFFGSGAYLCWYILPWGSFLLALAFYYRQKHRVQDTNDIRHKQANKVAQKRLQTAFQFLQEKQETPFYDEILRALWGYISDKLNIPLSRLSRDNIAEALASHQVEESCIHSFLSLLDETEMARFAPGHNNQTMNEIYTHTLELISRIESYSTHPIK